MLREVFDLPYDEIAAAVDKSPAAVRQIAHRAREHVEARRPRAAVTARERDEVIARFLGAAATGDLQALMDVLAPDVVLLTDGGGVKKAALRPIHGRDKVIRFLEAVMPEGFVGRRGRRQRQPRRCGSRSTARSTRSPRCSWRTGG